MNIAEIRQKAHTDPQSLTQKEWDAIHKDAFSVPKKDFSEDAKVSSSGPQNKQKRNGWW